MNFLGEERGFTLVEVLVTMVMMLTVMFALYSIFDMSLRVFSFSNDKTEAAQNARIGLERMEREIRAAYPYAKGDEESPDETIFTTWNSNEIAFGNDLNGDRTIGSGEEIAYRLSLASPPALLRNGGSAVEYVQADGLSFEYFEVEEGVTTELTPGVDDEGEIDLVRIELTVDKDDRVQTLTTNVALRNRGD